MANTPDQQDPLPQLIAGRAVITINENCHRGPTFYHGTLMAPKGVSYKAALEQIDAAFLVVNEDEEWNYTEFFDYLARDGYDRVYPATWWEHHAETE